MSNSSQKKRTRQQRYIFLLACLASLVGLVFYIYGRHKIPFPTQWLPGITDELKKQSPKLFCFGINIHLQVNFALGFLFIFFNREKTDHVKLKKWKHWISKILIMVFSLLFGMREFGKLVEKDWGNIFLLCLMITVINCCLLELLIQLMDQYGICSAFNLILFTEFLPTKWFKSEWNQPKMLELFGLFFITICFVWITNLKWEAPIDTNTLYGEDNKLLKKKKSKLGFKLSFSFMPLIYLSQFISFIYSIFLMRKMPTNWFSYSDITTNQQKSSITKQLYSETNTIDESSFSTVFFSLNENKAIFSLENIKKWFLEKKWIIFGALFLFVVLRWIVMWLQMRHVQWKPEEISKDLREKGIYINGIAPGSPTKKLLKSVINKLVFLWNIIILVFNVIFDSVFPSSLIFSSWFGGINIGIDLIKQIRTKYRYIRANK